MDRKFALSERAKAILDESGIKHDDFLQKMPQVGQNDCLFIAGSVVERLSNDRSDLDVLYVGERPMEARIVVSSTDINQAVSPVLSNYGSTDINVDAYPHSRLIKLENQVGLSFEQAFYPKLAKTLKVIHNDEDFRLLHRVRTGIPVTNDTVFENLQKRMRSDDLPAYVAVSQILFYFNVVVDVMGESDAGNHTSAAWINKFAYERLARAALATANETNASQKWILKLLYLHQHSLDPKIFGFLVENLSGPIEKLDLATTLEHGDCVVKSVIRRHPFLQRSITGFRKRIRHNNPYHG